MRGAGKAWYNKASVGPAFWGLLYAGFKDDIPSLTAPKLRLLSPLNASLLSLPVVAVTALCLLAIQSAISHVEGGHVRPFGIGFLLAVALITSLGGRVPGFFALASSTLTTMLVLTPLAAGGSYGRPRDWTELFFLLIVGSVVIHGLEALRQNEQLLSESEESRVRLRAVMDTAPVGVLLSDTTGKLIYANQEAERIWGQPLHVVRQEQWSRYRLLNADGTPTPPERTGLARVLAGEASIVRDERQIERSDGTRVFVEAVSTLVRDDHGRVRSGLVIFSDITARKQSAREIERLLAHEQLVNQIGRTSLETLDAALVHRVAADGLGTLLGADRCFFRLDGSYDTVYTPGQTLIVEDTQDEAVPQAQRLIFVEAGLRSAISTPLFSNGRLVKTLTVGMAKTPRLWTAAETALVEAIAVQTRAAAEAARSQQRERLIAMALQNALIPELPKYVLGLEMSSYYKSALEESSVGGDFMDVFVLQSGQAVFAVGDLSGKGLAAAAQVATVRNMLRYSLYRASRLDEALLELNNLVVGNELLTGFATLFVGVYEPKTHGLTYLSCGHDPGLLRRASTGEVELLPPDGDSISPVLGLVENGRFVQQSVTLQPGDTLFFCTDGVTEAGRDRGEFLGVAGVAQMLQDGPTGETIEELIARVVAGVREYAQGIQHDDICLLAAIVGSPKP